MKYFYLTFIAFVCIIVGPHKMYGINVELNAYNFYGKEYYTELYLRASTSDLESTIQNTRNFATLEFLLIIMNEADEIVSFDKFELTQDVTDIKTDMLDIRRVRLKEGVYTIKLEAKDKYKPESTLEIQKKWKIGPSSSSISDIIPLATAKPDERQHPLVKNGLYMEPLAYHFADTSFNQLDIYVEFYNTQQNPEALIMYQIIPQNKFGSEIKKYKKLKNLEIEPILLSFSMSSIVTGKYIIEVALIDKNKNILSASQTDLTVTNINADLLALEKYNSQFENSFVQKIIDEELDYILKAHLPITDQHQTISLKEIIKRGKPTSQKQFIFQLWESKIPSNPEEGFNKYMEIARAVDKKFYIAAGYGFQSDRGHLFLKYGKPSNVITIDTETDAYPYEIWYYDYLPLTGQTNVRFLFYNPTLSSTDFVLLHSTCYGERINPTWEQQIYKSALNADNRTINVDNPEVPDGWNRQARRYFNDY